MSIEEIYDKTLQMNKDGISISVCAGIMLIFESGCRVSSILKLCPIHVTANGRVILHQGKGSADLVVTPTYYKSWWKAFRKMKYSPYQYQNYMYYNRLFKRYSLCGDYNFGQYKAITATGRKMVAQDVFNAENDIETTARALGHNRTTSTEYYIKDKKNVLFVQKGILDKTKGYVDRLVVCKNGVIRTKPPIRL